MGKHNKKNENSSDLNDMIEEGQEPNRSEEVKEVEISFDVYFKMLLKVNKKVMPHHKIPMSKYAQAKIGDKATKTDFDNVFKNY